MSYLELRFTGKKHFPRKGQIEDCGKKSDKLLAIAIFDKHGAYRVLSYASRKLQDHDKNYTSFLFEMKVVSMANESL
jgi:hypothetical protein